MIFTNPESSIKATYSGGKWNVCKTYHLLLCYIGQPNLSTKCSKYIGGRQRLNETRLGTID